jgi:hypothetical protein
MHCPDCPATFTDPTAVDDQNLHAVSTSGFNRLDTSTSVWETLTPSITVAVKEVA